MSISKPILLPYQAKWVEDRSQLKIIVKGRQIGYSFAATLRVVAECVKRKTTWILLSKGERQSRLLMEKVIEHVKAFGLVAKFFDNDYFEGTSTKQLETRLPNGSVIYALPANPDTARGFSGNVTLDEFAFHADAEKIYAALYPSITRGYTLEVISTPNGQQGKFYELAKKAGLVSGQPSDPTSAWSAHGVDIFEAARQGLADMVPASDTRVDPALLEKVLLSFRERGIKPTQRMLRFVAALRAGVDDDESWYQEYCCQFVSTAENFFPPELYQACVAAGASIETPLSILCAEPGEFFLGIDIGRKHDRTVFWLDRVSTVTVHDLAGREVQKRIATTRLVRTELNMPFDQQIDVARELLLLKKSDGSGPLIRRGCIDATGMGAPIAEKLNQEFGFRVEPVVFTAAAKEDMAFRTLRLGQSGQLELPDYAPIRRAFNGVKKVVTAQGNIRFDAERTDAGHCDEFWGKSLCDLAAHQPGQSFEDYAALVGSPIVNTDEMAGVFGEAEMLNAEL